MKTKNLSNILLSLIFFFLSFKFFLKFNFSFNDAYFFPLFLSIILTISFLLSFFIEKREDIKISFKSILIIISIFSYAPLIYFFGFRISNVIFLSALGLSLYERKNIKLLTLQIISFILLSELITHYILKINLP